MRVIFGAFLLGCLPLAAQTPAAGAGQSAAPATTPAPAPTTAQSARPGAAATQPPQVENSDIGFSYSLPSGWEFVAPPPAQTAEVPYPDVVTVKKGDACVEVVFTAKRGTPATVVVVMALPFACYGQTLKASDLGNFGAGAGEGLKQTFDIADPVQGKYALGSHAVWIERAKGTPKGHPNDAFIFETACTVLAKGAVCWLTVAADWGNLRAFEQSPVTLGGDRFDALVPAHAFLSNP